MSYARQEGAHGSEFFTLSQRFLLALQLFLCSFALRDVPCMHDNTGDSRIVQKIFAHPFKHAPRTILMLHPEGDRARSAGHTHSILERLAHPCDIIGMHKRKDILPHDSFWRIAQYPFDSRTGVAYSATSIQNRNDV